MSQALSRSNVIAARPTAIDRIAVVDENACDIDARDALLDCAFGSGRYFKTCARLRAGRHPAHGLSLVARAVETGVLVGTVRLWHVEAGGVACLMLGPLAVEANYRGFGLGARLVDEAVARARALGHGAILLVGDAPYYARFGFNERRTRSLRMPGPIEAERFLALELTPGALADANGDVRATGALRFDQTRALPPVLRRAA